MQLLWGMCEGQYIEKWEYQEEFLLSPPISKLENFSCPIRTGQIYSSCHVLLSHLHAHTLVVPVHSVFIEQLYAFFISLLAAARMSFTNFQPLSCLMSHLL